MAGDLLEVVHHDVARAFNQTGRRDDAIATVLDAERMASEQVRHHYLGRQLVLGWVRTTVGTPHTRLSAPTGGA